MKESTMTTKMYNGPYGNYKAGTYGAVLNALAEQEGRPLTWIDQHVLGQGKLLKRSDESIVVATWEWHDNEIVFNFS